jgi:hypothetical protein
MNCIDWTHHMYFALKIFCQMVSTLDISLTSIEPITGTKSKLGELPIAASLCFFFIILSSLLNGFLNPSSVAIISFSFLCAARRSSKLQNSQLRISCLKKGLIRKKNSMEISSVLLSLYYPRVPVLI